MVAFLTSSLGGTYIDENGNKKSFCFLEDNNFIKNLKKHWIDESNVLIISSRPDDFIGNDIFVECFVDSCKQTDLSISNVCVWDNRNIEDIKDLQSFDVIVLTGGHVPTENEFINKIGLRDKLRDFEGLFLAWSAGSMNSADIVYALPEEEGEAINPIYNRFLSGLSLTQIMIIPHFQNVKFDRVDNLRVIEDIAIPDSEDNCFICLNDGSYIILDKGKEIIFGKAYAIENGRIKKICNRNRYLRVK